MRCLRQSPNSEPSAVHVLQSHPAEFKLEDGMVFASPFVPVKSEMPAPGKQGASCCQVPAEGVDEQLFPSRVPAGLPQPYADVLLGLL